MSRPTPTILRIAIPSPVDRIFDYLPPDHDGPQPAPGCRAKVPFGKATRIGIIVDTAAASELDRSKLKPVIDVLDEEPLLPPSMMALLTWAARYYHYPAGQVFSHALPALLRQGQAAEIPLPVTWQLTGAGRAVDSDRLKRAPRQQALWQRLQAQQKADISAGELTTAERTALRAMADKGWVESVTTRPQRPVRAESVLRQTPLSLSPDQQHAVDGIVQSLPGFAVHLLDGVTGSGKTEVYFHVIKQVLDGDGQVLVLVPEIGLTPQLLARFEQRFNVPLAVLHSALTDRERLQAWLRARSGEARIIIGTRSAVMVPCPQLGLIILDEEHDASFKQQDGFRYHARDLAIMRARDAGIAVIMGSATPSLESLHNADSGRYHYWRLPQRTGNAVAPDIRLIDVRHLKLHDGLSSELLQGINAHLDQDNQVLLFLNRRGYAPTLLCHDCGWIARCDRCDAHMIVHHGTQLRCHHCDARRRLAEHCPACQSTELRPLGHGTERLEEALRQLYPHTDVIRIDRDSTRRKGELNKRLQQVHDGRRQILLGTQMLAKGHHLPNVTLVGIIDADPGLYSTDFRASEHMGQLILQVAGRAGRADKPGEVLIQTHHPQHPLLQILLTHDYRAYAQYLLQERQHAALPPFCHFALLRAESVSRHEPIDFLDAARDAAGDNGNIELLGPVPAAMERKAGRYRAQLLLRSSERRPLHALIDRWLPALAQLPHARRVRWNIDVDPLETA